MKIKLKKEVPVKVRDAFVASKGYYWLSCDYSQLEYRALSNLAQDQHLIDAFNKGVDFHVATAAGLFNVPVEKVDKKMRKRGKCVTGDTVIFTKNKGLVKIKDLSSFRGVDQFDDIDISVPDRDGKYHVSPSFYYNGIQRVTNIVTKYGYKLGGSFDKHKILVVGEDGFPVYKKVSDISVGENVIFFTKGVENECKYQEFVIPEDWVYHFSFEGGPNETEKFYLDCLKEANGIRAVAAEKAGISVSYMEDIGRKFNVPCSIKGRPHEVLMHKITEEIAELWGMILSDGNFRKDGDYTSYTSTDKENFERFYDLARGIWGSHVTYDYLEKEGKLPYWTVRINSSFVARQFSHDKLGRKGAELEFPQEIFRSPKSVQRAFIIGWFNGDGHFLEKYVNTGSISENFVKDLQQLLLSFGIVSSVNSETPTTMRGTDYRYYKLVITLPFSYFKFNEVFGEGFITRKKERLFGIVERMSSKRGGANQLYEAKKGFVSQTMGGLTSTQKKNMYRFLNGRSKYLGKSDAELLMNSKSSTGEQKELLRQIFEGELISLPVRRIYETEEEVFDIFVPQGNEFVSSGFCSRNTLNFGIAYGMSAYGLASRLGCDVNEAKELIEKYFSDKPGVVKLQKKIKNSLLSKGYVRTVSGRIRWFKEDLLKAKTYSQQDRILKRGFNTVIQGSAADFAKIALAHTFELIKPYGDKIRMVSMVHDELNFEIHESIPKEEAIALIDAGMSFRSPHKGWCDIPGDIEIGQCYGAMEEVDKLGYDVSSIIKNYSFEYPSLEFLLDGSPNLETSDNGKFEFDKVETKGKDKRAGHKKEKETPPIQKDLDLKKNNKKVSLKTHKEKLGISEEPFSVEGSDFKVPSVYLKLKDGVQPEEASRALKSFISNNFGSNQLFIEHDGFIYKFPGEYHVNSEVSSLTAFFDVRVGGGRPKVKIEF